VGVKVKGTELGTELLKLWWEEVQTIERAHGDRRLRVLRDERLFHKCSHGDEKACLAHRLLALEAHLPEVLRAVARLTSLIRYTLDMAALEAHARGDREGFLRLLLSLPPSLRRWWLTEEDDLSRRWARELLGDLFEIVTKSRVEVKVVLTSEEALRAIELWGADWREKLRETVREAVREQLTRGT
jgi:hypothetical protein